MIRPIRICLISFNLCIVYLLYYVSLFYVSLLSAYCITAWRRWRKTIVTSFNLFFFLILSYVSQRAGFLSDKKRCVILERACKI